MTRLPVMPRGPPADAADPEQDAERDDEQQYGEARRSFRVAAVQALEDVERRDLCLERAVARDQDDRAELADRARERECDAREERRQEVRKHDAAEHRHSAGTERRSRFL